MGTIDPPGFARTPKNIEEARFRQVLGHFATGVTIVTGVAGEQRGVTGVAGEQERPVGLSVSSFTSVSLDPALVAFCVTRASSSWPKLRAAGAFCVNILADDQEALARTFASHGVDRFEGIGWRAAPSGAPILAGVLAWVDCTVEAEHEAGDHIIVVGRVRDLEVVHEGRPLVFYRGGYGRFEL